MNNLIPNIGRIDKKIKGLKKEKKIMPNSKISFKNFKNKININIKQIQLRQQINQTNIF